MVSPKDSVVTVWKHFDLFLLTDLMTQEDDKRIQPWLSQLLQQINFFLLGL